jgi:ribosome-associated protein
VILDLRKLSFSFDYFFLCSASSSRRLQTVADHIWEALTAAGRRPNHQEGSPEGGWVLLDCGAVVGHVFSLEARRFYQLERLWADAPRVRLPKA